MQDQDKEFEDDFDDMDFMDGDDDFGDDFSEEELDEELTQEDLDFLEEDTAFGEEEDWDEESFGEEEQGDGKKKKKKKKAPKSKKPLSVNTMVVLGAVAVGAIVMVWSLAQPEKDQLPKERPFQSALSPQGQVNNPVTVPANEAKQQRIERENESQEGGFLKNPTEIDGSQTPQPVTDMADTGDIMGDVAPPMPAPIVSDDSDSALTPMPDFGQDDAGDALPVPRAPEIASEQESQDEAMSAAELLENKIAERQQAMTETQEEPQEVVEEEIEEVMEVELPAAPEPEIAEAKDDDGFGTDMPAPETPAIEETAMAEEMDVPPSPSVSTAEMDSLQDELDSTKDELEEVRSASKDEIASLNAEIEKLKAELEKKSSQPAETVKTQTAEPVKKAAPKKAASTPKAQPKKWELRAAMPGKAWVSESGKKEMRSVVVGDSLSGIGRVTAITYSNGVWVVQGTQGSIKQ